MALGYKGDMIRDYFYKYELINNDVTIELGNNNSLITHNNHGESGWKITFVDTGERALKGARLKRLEKYIDGDNFMVTYGDGVGNVNIPALVEFHRGHGKLATVTAITPASPFGMLTMSGDSVTNFAEKPEGVSATINGGFFVFNKGIFNYLSDHDQCDLERGSLERVAREGQLKAYRHQGFWSCMDTYRDAEYLNELWNENKAGWKIW